MRFDGTLKTWNAERGFGFIAPRQGGQDIFVHISVFPRDGRSPREGEVLSFEVETTAEGKKRALRVQRPGQPATAAQRPNRERRNGRRRSGLGATVLGLALAAALGWYAYGEYPRRTAGPAASARPLPVETVPMGTFQCNGRTHCSQMTSCAEAKFFLKNCPGVQMDGNHDGVPCEQQWCTSPFAK